MDLAFTCPQCEAPNRVAEIDRSTVLTCERCDYLGVLPLSWHRQGKVELCPMCGSEALFCRREFRLGLIVIILLIGALLAPRTRLLSMVAAVVVVGIHMLRAGEHLSCYRCGSQITGHHPPGQHGRYDPSIAAGARAAKEPDGDRSNSPR